jgi:hypothetical protein
MAIVAKSAISRRIVFASNHRLARSQIARDLLRDDWWAASGWKTWHDVAS